MTLCHKVKQSVIAIPFTYLYTGSPNCPSAHTTVTTTSLTVSIQKPPMTWLPEWYSVNVISYNESIGIVVYNFTLKGTTSFNVTSLEPGTVYNISVISCNMAGCNESCDLQSVTTEPAETASTTGEMDRMRICAYHTLPLLYLDVDFSRLWGYNPMI